MAKKTFQDVIKIKNNKNDRIIPEKEGPIRIVIKKDPVYFASASKEDQWKEEDNSNSGFKYGLWLIALFSVIFLLFAISFLFAGAKVTVSPRTQDLVLSQNFNAVKDSSDSNVLSFDLVSIAGEQTEKIQGGEAADVALKAEGTVRIFNAFNASPQVFSANTRLSGSNGKTYQTETKVTVPGMSADSTPGSVLVTVVAAEIGQDYNSTPLDFNITAFKGTPKYSKIYARSEGNIKGGLKGKFSQISSDQKTNALNDLKNILQTKLLKKASEQIPSGYILFKDAVFLADDGGDVGIPGSDGSVSVTLKGTFYGFLFKEDALTKKITEADVQGYNGDGTDIYIVNLKDLTFSLTDKENISFKNVANINFILSGPAKVVWKVDTEKLVSDLLGKSKKDFNQVLSGYPDIASADLVIKPVWGMSFPDKSKDIKVIVNYP